MRAGKPTDNEQGYTLIAVLVAVAVVGILVGSAVGLSSTESRREKEAELLFRGQAYARAIRSYVEASPAGERAFPKRVEDLLFDPRAQHRRHLRAPYRDPMTGGDWRLLLDSDGGIVGVASASAASPMKRARFPQRLSQFEGARTYAEWEFRGDQPAGALPGRATPR